MLDIILPARLIRALDGSLMCMAMKKYKVMVEGLNFLIRVDTETTKHGFFTTRFVEAWDEDEAESKVVEMLRVELKTLVQNVKSDSPMMFVEEIEAWNRLVSSGFQEPGSFGIPTSVKVINSLAPPSNRALQLTAR